MTDLLIFGGGGNMEGRTERMPTPPGPAEGIREYRLLTGVPIPLSSPVGENIPPHLAASRPGSGSLLPDFCRTYRGETGRDVLAVHAAKGETCIRDWLPDTDRYRVTLEKILGAKRAAGQELGRVYFIWLQGETDAVMREPGEMYLERLTVLKNALKRDAGTDAFCIIRAGYFTPEHAYDEAVMKAQERACADDSDFIMLTRITAGLSLDPAWMDPDAPGQYGGRAMKRIGECAGHALAQFEKGRA